MKRAAKAPKAKPDALGEINVKVLVRRIEKRIAAEGKLALADVLDLAEALRERLPFDCSEVVGDYAEEHQDAAAREISDLCCVIESLYSDREWLGVGR